MAEVLTRRPRKKRMNQREMAQQVELLKKRLLHDISDLKPGDILPSENELFEKFHFSRAVIRNLYKGFQSDGIIQSEGSRGYFLTDKFHSTFSDHKKYNLSIAVVAYIEHANPLSVFSAATRLMSSFESHAAKYGSCSKLFNTDGRETVTLDMLEQIRKYRPDAIIYQPHGMLKNERNLQTLNLLDIPVITSEPFSDIANCVVFDHEQIAITAITHLLEKGHRKIAFIQSEDHGSLWQRQRLDGVRKIIEQSNATCKIIEAGFKYEDDDHSEKMKREIIPELISSGVTGLVGSGDEYAAMAIDALKALDKRVPEDMAVVGIDDNWAFRRYDLTTVQLSFEKIGVTAFNLLADIIQGKKHQPCKVKVQCPLIVKSSS